MRMYVKVMAAVIACILLSGEALSAFATTPATENLSWFKKKKKKPEEKEEKSKSDYEKLVEDSKTTKGMFAVHQKKNDYYFEIPTSLLGRDLLVVNKLQRVPAELNDAGVNRGVNYENQMVCMEWDKATGKLMLRQQRPLPLAPQTDAIFRSVKDNFISPLIAAFKIEAVNADSTALVIKVNDIYDGTETSINNVFTNINLGTSAIKNLSRILSIKSFSNNVVATSELTTRVTEGTTTVYVTVEVSSSILLLPEKPMMGRFDNQKVGYFTNPLLSFSDAQQRTDKTQYITRWRMEPKPEDREAYLKGQMVEPAKPIVFYIDNSTPYQWRSYIKKGIEDWQIAFEKAGFKNAIIAKEITDSMHVDMDDVNYSVLTYAASEKKNAMGPSLLDPRSGEILEADIMWWHNVLSMVREWITVQTGTVCPEARNVQLPDALMGDAIRFVACHEVGHSLGLRHNMMGSWAFPTDSLRSEAFTSRMNSTASSIMDYARFNYIAQPGDGVKVLSPHIGPYDMFAIEYGYRWYGKSTPEEEKDILFDFLSKHTDRLYKYSEAQDVRDAVDPRAQNEDLGDDPVRSSLLGIENLKRIVPQILQWTTTGEKGQTYEEASRLYYAVINQWNNYLYHVLANIGGIYIENTIVGDGVKTYTFVEKEKQQASLKFLMDEVLTYPKWLFDTEVGQYTYPLKSRPVRDQGVAAKLPPAHPGQQLGFQGGELGGGAAHLAVLLQNIVFGGGQDDLPPVEVGDVVGDLLQVPGDVAGQEDGVLLVGDEGEQLLQNAVPDHWVQSGGGLVQNEQPGPVGQGGGQGQLHLHSPGKLLQIAVGWQLQPLEQAVERLTSRPASVLGLAGKGSLAVGMDADLCLFDPARIHETASYAAPERCAEGMDYVFVGGVPVIAEGQFTGAVNGSVLRR